MHRTDFRALWIAPLALFACTSVEKPGPGNEVQIVGADYAFTAPAAVPAGRTVFRFANRGKAFHELNISRLKPGVSIEQFLDTVRAGQSVQSVSDGRVGVLFAPPGGESSGGLTVQLAPGERYVLICVFRDSPKAKLHYDLGMYSVISIKNAQAVAPLPQHATDTITAVDYAFKYPRTLKAGRHTFAMRNEGKQTHEAVFGLLKKGVSFEHVLEVQRKGGDVDSLFDGQIGLLQARSGQVPLGEMTIDMPPEREYVIGCFFSDTPTSPPHVALGMYGSMRTSAAAPN
jgi:hypothetical protein